MRTGPEGWVDLIATIANIRANRPRERRFSALELKVLAMYACDEVPLRLSHQTSWSITILVALCEEFPDAVVTV